MNRIALSCSKRPVREAEKDGDLIAARAGDCDIHPPVSIIVIEGEGARFPGSLDLDLILEGSVPVTQQDG